MRIIWPAWLEFCDERSSHALFFVFVFTYYVMTYW